MNYLTVVLWVLVGGALCVAGSLLYLERRRAGGKTRTVALVKRRRELAQRLGELAGDSASKFAQLEARRQGEATTSIAVLEAAVARAERAKATDF